MRNKSGNKRKSDRLLELIASYAAVKVYKKRNNNQAIYNNLKKLKPLYGKKSSYHYELFTLAYDQEMWEKALKHIDDSINIAGKSVDANLYLSKAYTLANLKKSSEAITYLKKYLQKNPSSAKGLKKISNEYFKLNQWNNAIETFETYLKINNKDSNAYFKLAESYYQINNVENAVKNYEQSLENQDKKLPKHIQSTAYYKLGLLNLKNNDQYKANQLFKKAIKLDKKLKGKDFGIGVFHEHYKQYNYAIEAYKESLSQDDKNADLYFKLAKLLEKTNELDEAIKYYNQALKIDKTQADWHYALANCYEKVDDYHNAAIYYQNAIDRSLMHKPTMYRKLGFTLSNLGETESALNAYRDADLFAKPNVVKPNVYKRDIDKVNVRYGICYHHYQVKSNMIFYESMSGGRMMGNPYAIFEYIIEDQNFKDYIHVWVVNSFQVIPDEFKSKDNIVFVKKGSDAYFKYISSAKYLICNSTFEPYVVRKPDQYYLQTSHGIFYKTVGRDSSNTPIGVAGGTRNLLQATHIIVPNEYMAKKQPKSYSIKDIHSGTIAKIGYPRIDVTVNISEETRQSISNSMGLDPSKKIVFYAPTWRGDSKANNRFDSEQLLDDLEKLATLDVNVVFRGHPITNSLLKEVKLPKNIIVPTPDIQTNELLGMSDILISDYSSVFFDFIVTEKPIIHYLYDLEEYKKERGLNLAESDLPGDIALTSNQLIKIIKKRLKKDKPSSHYLKAKERFCTFDDGRSSERVVNWFFYNDVQNIEFVENNDAKKSYLFLGGSLDNKSEISTMVNEVNKLRDNNNVVSLMLNPGVKKDKEKMKLLSKLNPDVNLIAHAKNMPHTIEEANAIDYYNENEVFANDEMENNYDRAFKRQARRLFGDASFDEVRNYVTKSHYWASLSKAINVKNGENE